MTGTILFVCLAPWLLILAVLFAWWDWLPVAPRSTLPLLLVSVVALLGWSAWGYPELSHRHTSYRLDRLGLSVRKGVWWRRAIFVPRSRIQHTDVSQGPIERNYGLATLRVFTAGTEFAEVSLPGLSHENALRIRDHLIAGDEPDGV